MSRFKQGLTAVWIASDRPSKAEQAIIDQIGNCLLMNAKFFSTKPSESVGATRVYNLSGRKEIDEFYKDILVTSKVVIDVESIKDEPVQEEKQEQEEKEVEDESEQKQDAPAKRPGRPARTSSKN